ncbi:RNA-directed DNA polymerase, eukaryota, partial [Tanacetum coccineum]
KDVRSMLDEAFLLKMEVPTRWIKSIPIKVNVFAWKLYLDRLPTRSNLSRRNVSLPSLACPLCDHVLEDSSHLFFGCSVAKDIQKLICRWLNLDVHPYESYEDWLSWFKSIRLGSKTKEVLEGVFYVSCFVPLKGISDIVSLLRRLKGALVSSGYELSSRRCQKIGHQSKDYRSKTPATGSKSKHAVTCFGCGEQVHYKNRFPRLKNQNRCNQKEKKGKACGDTNVIANNANA